VPWPWFLFIAWLVLMTAVLDERLAEHPRILGLWLLAAGVILASFVWWLSGPRGLERVDKSTWGWLDLAWWRDHFDTSWRSEDAQMRRGILFVVAAIGSAGLLLVGLAMIAFPLSS
jgi:hypothetical protein